MDALIGVDLSQPGAVRFIPKHKIPVRDYDEVLFINSVIFCINKISRW